MSASNATSSSRKARQGEPPGSGESSSSTAKRFALSGPSLALDPRIHAYRRDIADIALAGELFAPHYARPMLRSCGARPAIVRSAPSDEADQVSELLPGEEFAVLDLSGHWAWGYCRADHYVGYVEAIALVEPFEPTHIVAAAEAVILSAADAASAVLAELPLGARLAGHEESGFLAMDGGFVPLFQLRRIEAVEPDPASIAERLLGAPYRMGGRTPAGIDCSGLVQIAFALCGFPAPRDSDQQRVIGEPLPKDSTLQRNDLIFFHKHVGLMLDPFDLIHANATTGNVAVEPLAAVAARLGGDAIEDRRRLKL